MLPGVLVAHRPVSAGDEERLAPAEIASMSGCVPEMCRRAAAARIAARELLADMGWPGFALPRMAGGGPVWPSGLAGSLSHAPSHAAAALASCTAWLSVGIDVEPAEALEDEVFELIATRREAACIGPDPLSRRLLFCAKEAAYKAMFALDATFLEPQEVMIDLAAGLARSAYGRSVRFVRHADSRIMLVLAAVG